MRKTITIAALLASFAGSAIAGDWEVSEVPFVGAVVSSASAETTIKVGDREQAEEVARILNQFDDKKDKKDDKKAS